MIPPQRTHRIGELAWICLKLGLTSFGGPVAHLGYFHAAFVKRRAWLSEDEFADLVALCQFLPGPASSQVVFAIGQKRAGLIGAMAASLSFLLPSTVLMIAFGYGVSNWANRSSTGWLHGFKLAAVAVVAQAVWIMGRKLCPDWPRILLGLIATATVLFFPSVVVQIGVIALGGAVGWIVFRRAKTHIHLNVAEKRIFTRHHLWAATALIGCGALLLLLPLFAAENGSKGVRVFDGFYRAGALVFGGGHVVLPLLRAEVVPHGWVGDDTFLAGYGVAQALPGPLFSFAAYLGTVIFPGPHAWLGGLWCLLAIFLPAWLLIGGALPFWNLLRGQLWSQAALRGANAVVVGILLAALINPMWTETVRSFLDVALVVGAWALLQLCRWPSWLVVLLCAAAGQWSV